MISRHFILLFIAAWAFATPTRPDPEEVFGPPTQRQKPNYEEGWGAGALTTSILADVDTAHAVVLETSGYILLGGDANNGTDADFALVRYHPDGLLDTTFATTGKKTLAPGPTAGHDVIKALVLQTDGLIVAAGYSRNNNYDFQMARFQTNGELDTSFNTSGKIGTTILDNGDFANAVLIETDGRLVAGGYTWLLSKYHYALARYRTNGALDTSFNTNGRVFKMMSASDNGILAISKDTTNRYVVAGPVYSSNWDFGVARYLSNGRLDSSFNTAGTATVAVVSSHDKNYTVGIQEDESILMTGYANDGNSLNVAAVRLLSNGRLDTSFNTTGKRTLEVHTGSDGAGMSLFLQSDGKAIVGGYSYNGSNDDFAILRFLTNGSLDTTFNTNGKNSNAVRNAQDRGAALTFNGGDAIFLVGSAVGDLSSNLDFSLARYQTDGSAAGIGALDINFGT